MIDAKAKYRSKIAIFAVCISEWNPLRASNAGIMGYIRKNRDFWPIHYSLFIGNNTI